MIWTELKARTTINNYGELELRVPLKANTSFRAVAEVNATTKELVRLATEHDGKERLDSLYVLMDASLQAAEAFGAALRNCTVVSSLALSGAVQFHFLPLHFVYLITKIYDPMDLAAIGPRWFFVVNGEVHRPLVEPCAVCARFEERQAGACSPVVVTCTQNVFCPGHPLEGWFDRHVTDPSGLEAFKDSFRPAKFMNPIPQPGLSVMSNELSVDLEVCMKAYGLRSTGSRLAAVTMKSRRTVCKKCIFFLRDKPEEKRKCYGCTESVTTCGGYYAEADLVRELEVGLKPWMVHVFNMAGPLMRHEKRWQELSLERWFSCRSTVYLAGPARAYDDKGRAVPGVLFGSHGAYVSRVTRPYDWVCERMGILKNPDMTEARSRMSTAWAALAMLMAKGSLYQQVRTRGGAHSAHHYSTQLVGNEANLTFSTNRGRNRGATVITVGDLVRNGLLAYADIRLRSGRRLVAKGLAEKYKGLYAAARAPREGGTGEEDGA